MQSIEDFVNDGFQEADEIASRRCRKLNSIFYKGFPRKKNKGEPLKSFSYWKNTREILDFLEPITHNFSYPYIKVTAEELATTIKDKKKFYISGLSAGLSMLQNPEISVKKKIDILKQYHLVAASWITIITTVNSPDAGWQLEDVHMKDLLNPNGTDLLNMSIRARENTGKERKGKRADNFKKLRTESTLLKKYLKEKTKVAGSLYTEKNFFLNASFDTYLSSPKLSGLSTVLSDLLKNEDRSILDEITSLSANLKHFADEQHEKQLQGTYKPISKELESPLFNKYLSAAKHFGCWNEIEGWTKSIKSLASFVHEICPELGMGKGRLSDGRMRTEWKAFEQFFEIEPHKLRQAYSDIQKNGKDPKDYPYIEQIIELVKTESSSK